MTTKEITINKNRYRLLNKFPSSTKGKYMENSVENMHIDITVFQRSMTMHTSSFAFTVFMKGNMLLTRSSASFLIHMS